MPPRVLIIDDDEDLSASLVGFLQQEGCQVWHASEGEEGYARLLEVVPDLVLLDIRMPRANGWLFRAAQLREPSLAAIPVVIMSGLTSSRQTAESVGAVDFLEKPINPDLLLGLVRRFSRSS